MTRMRETSHTKGKSEMKMLIIAAMLIGSTTLAMAQSQSYYDRHGSFTGSSSTHNGNMAFRDRHGHFTGSAITHGNSTAIYDARGRYQGTVTNRK
jgi:hypothetical protein